MCGGNGYAEDIHDPGFTPEPCDWCRGSGREPDLHDEEFERLFQRELERAKREEAATWAAECAEFGCHEAGTGQQ